MPKRKAKEKAKPKSRQRQWQDKMTRAGKCYICGLPLNKHKYRCDECQQKENERNRNRKIHVLRKQALEKAAIEFGTRQDR